MAVHSFFVLNLVYDAVHKICSDVGRESAVPTALDGDKVDIVIKCAHFIHEKRRVSVKIDRFVLRAMVVYILNPRHFLGKVNGRRLRERAFNRSVVVEKRAVKRSGKIGAFGVVEHEVTNGAVGNASLWGALGFCGIDERRLTAHASARRNNGSAFRQIEGVENNVHDFVGISYRLIVHPRPRVEVWGKVNDTALCKEHALGSVVVKGRRIT